jgi:glycerol-3-phosphate dehydrogenase
MAANSSASSKLLHGGLRYLETGQFLLVRESLHERDAWIKPAPVLTRPLPIVLPIYRACAVLHS